ncbi:hypothetical protein C2S52_009950 [Perilla frutescens var. hirtella]|nr:hypothetical protein C2S52_009950 [Perilla frutescens var. hirtella]
MQDGNNDDFVHGQIMVKSQLRLVHREKIVGPVTHKMERRNKADLKKTGKLMSPFMKRSVDISSK